MNGDTVHWEFRECKPVKGGTNRNVCESDIPAQNQRNLWCSGHYHPDGGQPTGADKTSLKEVRDHLKKPVLGFVISADQATDDPVWFAP